MNLNLAQRSLKVIDLGTNRKRVYVFLLVINSKLDPILHRFRDTAALNVENYQSNPVVVHYFDTALLVMDYQSHPEPWGEIDNFGGTKKIKGAIWEKPILSGLMHKTIIVTLKH